MTNRELTSGHRSAGIPLDYLISEMIAYPLTSTSAFENGVTNLDPDMQRPTADLWRDAERQIVRGAPDLSIDQAAAIRDRLWFNRGFTFSEYLNRWALPGVCDYQGAVAEEAARTGIKELLGGRFFPASPTYASLRAIYRDLARSTVFKLPDDPENVFLADPIAHLTPLSPGKELTPEIQFVHRGISHLNRSRRNPDPFFAGLFWQVIRIRGILYRHVVQRPLTPGLQWFVRTYSRIKPGRITVGRKFVVRAAAKTCGVEKGLRSLEVRTSPEKSSSKILEIVRDFMDGMGEELRGGARRSPNESKDDKFEFGVVFHFVKSRGGGASKGLPGAGWRDTEAAPRVMTPDRRETRCRYSHYYRRKKEEATALGRLLFNFPKTLKIVRAVDICTDEMGVPAWVLAPLLRYVRDAGYAAARRLRYELNEKVPELRVTAHTGEDFIHLLGGMRRVEETVRYFKLRPGDRLGHAISLGVDPAEWAERKGRLAMAREERLLDLIWEWTQYSRDRVPYTTGRFALIEREIERLTKLLFQEPYSAFEMETLIGNLHDERVLSLIGYPDHLGSGTK